MKCLRAIALIALSSRSVWGNELHDFFAPPDLVEAIASDVPVSSAYDSVFSNRILEISVDKLADFLKTHRDIDLNEPLPSNRSLQESLLLSGRTDLFEVLRHKGLRLAPPASQEGERLLIAAAQSRSSEPLRYLIRQGFNPNHIVVRENISDSPLSISIYANALEPFRYLLSLDGVDPLLEVGGITALQSAVTENRVTMVQEILANLRVHRRLHELDGTGILSLATMLATHPQILPERLQAQMADSTIATNNRRILRDLIDAGADPHFIFIETSAWQIAQENNSEEVLAIFRSRQPTSADRLRSAILAFVLLYIQHKSN